VAEPAVLRDQSVPRPRAHADGALAYRIKGHPPRDSGAEGLFPTPPRRASGGLVPPRARRSDFGDGPFGFGERRQEAGGRGLF
jgi:hypothetical protein